MRRRRRSKSEEEQLGPDLQLKLSLPRMAAADREEHSAHKSQLPRSPMTSSCSSSSEYELGIRSSDHVGGEDGTAAPMVLAGCPRCLMYILLPATDPECPKCKSRNLVDFHGGDRRRR